MFNMREYNALGQILDRTFGRGSIGDKGFAIRHNLGVCHTSGRPILELRYETALNFNPRHGMVEQKKSHDKISQDVLSSLLKEVKSEFKELTGKNLKLKDEKVSEPQIDHISHNPSLIRARYSRVIVNYLEN